MEDPLAGSVPSPTRRLLKEARQGSRGAMEEFFTKLRPRVQAWVSARLGPRLKARMEADDLVQEILLKAFEGMGDFEDRGGTSFYAWLFTIAEHRIAESSDHIRAKKRDPAREREMNSRLPGKQTSPSRAAGRKETHAALLDAMAGLSPRYRDILRLRRLEELSNEEAGVRMNITAKNASVLYVRAVEALRKLMAGDV